MKKLMSSALLVGIIFTLAGCNNNEEVVERQQQEIESLQNEVAALELTVANQQAIIESQEEVFTSFDEDFSYLADLTDAESKAYEQFAETNDPSQLSFFAPEKILLVYLHSSLIDDTDALYVLTYNDGTLPEDIDSFRELYYTGGLEQHDSDVIMANRYYDTVSVREVYEPDESVAVDLSVSLGTTGEVTVFGLKKESGIWKMDVLHLANAMNE